MENNKKPFYKRWWAWVIVIVVVPLAINIIVNPVSTQDQAEQIISEGQENSFSEQVRKEIFNEILVSERNAQKEADILFPTDLDKNVDKFRELQAQGEVGIKSTYKIDEKTYFEIYTEGAQKGWIQEYDQNQ